MNWNDIIFPEKVIYMLRDKYVFPLFFCIGVLAFLMFSQGCSLYGPVKNQTLKDKMLACSASLGENISLSLGEHIDKSLVDGKISSSFDDEVLSIFSNINDFPKEDRLKLYEDYIACIKTLSIPRDSK